MANKPVKRGFKMWCRANFKTDYLLQFYILVKKDQNKKLDYANWFYSIYFSQNLWW